MTMSLIKAAKERRLDIIKKCLEEGENIDFICDSTGRTALIWAAAFGFSEIVQYLLSQKASHLIRSKQRETAFLAAVIYDKLEVVKVFIQQKCVVQADLEEALLIAAKAGNLPIVQHLYSIPIQYVGRTKEGRNAFLLAVEHGALEVVQFLYHQNPRESLLYVDNMGNAAAHITVLYSHLKIMNFFIEVNPNLIFTQKNKANLDVYTLAVLHNKLDLAKLLLEMGCYIDASIFSGKIPNAQAAKLYNASSSIFKALDPKKSNELLKDIAVLEGNLNGRRLVDGNTALHLAILQGHVTSMFNLVSSGASLDIKNKRNVTPYQVAITHQDYFVQTIGYFYKAKQMLETQSTLVSLKSPEASPRESKRAVESKKISEVEQLLLKTGKLVPKDEVKEVKEVKESIEHENLEKILKVTVDNLSKLCTERFVKHSHNVRMISYMCYCLGVKLFDVKPSSSMRLLQKVQETSKDNYYSAAHFKIYYLVKLNKIKLIPPSNSDPVFFRLYVLIRELLFAKEAHDLEGISIQHYIQEYTQESSDQIQLKALPEIVKHNSIEMKEDFLKLLQIIHERKKEFLDEIKRLKEDLKILGSPERGGILFTKTTSPLQPIPEIGRIVIPRYYDAEGFDAVSAGPASPASAGPASPASARPAGTTRSRAVVSTGAAVEVGTGTTAGSAGSAISGHRTSLGSASAALSVTSGFVSSAPSAGVLSSGNGMSLGGTGAVSGSGAAGAGDSSQAKNMSLLPSPRQFKPATFFTFAAPALPARISASPIKLQEENAPKMSPRQLHVPLPFSSKPGNDNRPFDAQIVKQNAQASSQPALQMYNHLVVGPALNSLTNSDPTVRSPALLTHNNKGVAHTTGYTVGGAGVSRLALAQSPRTRGSSPADVMQTAHRIQGSPQCSLGSLDSVGSAGSHGAGGDKSVVEELPDAAPFAAATGSLKSS